MTRELRRTTRLLPLCFALALSMAGPLHGGADAFDRGEKAMSVGDYESALTLFEDSPGGDPDSLRSGSEYRQANIGKAIAGHPKEGAATDYDREIAFFEKLATANPKAPYAFLNFGFSYVDTVYWDQIFLSESSQAPRAVLTRADAFAADLHFRGFSKAVIDAARTQPEYFLYDEVSPVSQWNPTQGFYTHYGDVRELVRGADDMPVIMGSGDEMRLLFDPAAFPPLADGWKRDFLLLVDGWAKDADANTAFSTSVAPLPFHAMSAYPYAAAEHYPDDEAHREYQSKYNTRPALKLVRPLDNNRGNITELWRN